MNSKALSMVSILAGIALGLASTYPIQLSMVPSLILWALAGIILGPFAATTNDVLRGGILYGVFLAISFLFSRFGGTADQIARYSSLVAVACIPEYGYMRNDCPLSWVKTAPVTEQAQLDNEAKTQLILTDEGGTHAALRDRIRSLLHHSLARAAHACFVPLASAGRRPQHPGLVLGDCFPDHRSVSAVGVPVRVALVSLKGSPIAGPCLRSRECACCSQLVHR